MSIFSSSKLGDPIPDGEIGANDDLELVYIGATGIPVLDAVSDGFAVIVDRSIQIPTKIAKQVAEARAVLKDPEGKRVARAKAPARRPFDNSPRSFYLKRVARSMRFDRMKLAGVPMPDGKKMLVPLGELARWLEAQGIELSPFGKEVARIGGIVPELPELTAEEAQAMVEGLVAVNEIQFANGAPSIIKAIENGTVRYKRADPYEQWQNVNGLHKTGSGDCEDLASAVAAELRSRGEGARVKFVKTRKPGLLHAVVELTDGTIKDPSVDAGMGYDEV